MSVNDNLDLIDAVIYGDAFDCAVTFDEIRRYSRVRVTRAELHERLSQPALQKLIADRGGLYFLAGREELAEQRGARRERAQRLKRRARLVAGWLQHTPFVRGILLTGSVAADDAEDSADVDVLVIVAPGRIALAFVLLGTLSRLFSRQVFCPNYYLSEGHLTFVRRDRYVARELIQADPLTCTANSLLAANSWAQEQLPNKLPSGNPVKPIPGGALMQRLLEAAFRGRFGDRCERRANRLAVNRLTAHYGSFGCPVPEDVQERFERGIELRFHGAPRVNQSVERYEMRRAELAVRLREAMCVGTDTATG